jgi:hypothetical protein
MLHRGMHYRQLDPTHATSVCKNTRYILGLFEIEAFACPLRAAYTNLIALNEQFFTLGETLY